MVRSKILDSFKIFIPKVYSTLLVRSVARLGGIWADVLIEGGGLSAK